MRSDSRTSRRAARRNGPPLPSPGYLNKGTALGTRRGPSCERAAFTEAMYTCAAKQALAAPAESARRVGLRGVEREEGEHWRRIPSFR